VVKSKITDSIGALDREWIIVPYFQEPRIFSCEEGSGSIIRPQLNDNINT
jgi:hypothetical protein